MGSLIQRFFPGSSGILPGACLEVILAFSGIEKGHDLLGFRIAIGDFFQREMLLIKLLIPEGESVLLGHVYASFPKVTRPVHCNESF